MPVHGSVYELNLLGPWSLRCGGRIVDLRVREQRVLALLGILGPQTRGALAAMLWPESPEHRARSNLRTSLLRLRRQLGSTVGAGREDVRLSDAVAVDVSLLRAVLDMVETEPHEVSTDPLTVLRVLRSHDLLVDWYDEWVLEERDRLHRRRYLALERLARVSLADGRAADAIAFAEEAVRLEPLHEHAVTLHIDALLADGDLSAALREYRRFRDRIRDELGVAPPRDLTERLISAKAERAGVSTAVGVRGRV
jgi:DNA-binding SARP family transcriptional activator